MVWDLEDREAETIAEADLQIVILDEILRFCDLTEDERNAIKNLQSFLGSQIEAIAGYEPPTTRPAAGARISYLDDMGFMQSVFTEMTDVTAVMLGIGTEAAALKLGKFLKQYKNWKNAAKHGHHSFPKFLGGAVKQTLTYLKVPEHRELHKLLNRFLLTKKKTIIEDGVERVFDMYARKGNPGQLVRSVFSRRERLSAVAEFYKGPGKKFKSAAADFFKQYPGLK